MNRPIRRVAVFCGLLVLALMIRANWLGYIRSDELTHHENNRRVQIARFAAERGDIYVGGTAITGSRATDGTDFKFKRIYRQGPMYAPVTGYFSQVYGSNHLEALNDKLLTGSDNRLFFSRTRAILTGEKPRGGAVLTTIVPEAQKAAYEGLGRYKGAVVALDPRTGAILALVSTPSYDPSLIAGSSGKDARAWKRLTKDPDKPMSNRALKETFPPGSTFKLITAAAALEHGVVTDIDKRSDAPAPYTLPDTSTSVGNVVPDEMCDKASLKVGMQWSCNNVFLDLASELGEDRMRETAEKFGFNDGEVDTPVRAGKSLYPSGLNRPQTALTGMGQGSLTSTPLQMAMMTAAVANDGKLMRPYMVQALKGPNLESIEEHDPEVMSQAVSQETARKVQEMVENTARNGSGKSALIDGVTVGAKTGTAQHGVKNAKLPYAWFVAYAKTDEGSPVAVAVFIDPEGADIPRERISGGGLAGPVAKQVMEAVLNR